MTAIELTILVWIINIYDLIILFMSLKKQKGKNELYQVKDIINVKFFGIFVITQEENNIVSYGGITIERKKPLGNQYSPWISRRNGKNTTLKSEKNISNQIK